MGKAIQATKKGLVIIFKDFTHFSSDQKEVLKS